MKSAGKIYLKALSATLSSFMAIWWQYKEKAPTDDVEASVSVRADTGANIGDVWYDKYITYPC